jgi:gamma-glutamyltranspeptidase/glutathione hydrolase
MAPFVTHGERRASMTGGDRLIGMMETWQVRKPAVESRGGIVASQHFEASRVGARVLAEGGNAVDAAVAAGIAIGTVEPWMSGLGGGGQMLVYLARENRAYCVDFGMRAPKALDPDDYPLVAGTDSDLFAWPAVHGERNVHGPQAVAVPGFVAGMALALERFGTRSWRESVAPAIALARRGMSIDWYATLKIAAAARTLSLYEESARTYLPDGHAPAGEWGGPLPHMDLGNLATTLERLARLGGPLGAADLVDYQARVVPAPAFNYRDARVTAAPGLTAGPTLARALELLAERGAPGTAPDPDMYTAYASSLWDAYGERFERLGDHVESGEPTCTTHLSVVDEQGNLVALTQTLLSVFGSKVMLPGTGVLMNNGIMWFDPRPGLPNSLAPSKRPLSNMCPTIVERADGLRFAVGASGGRRIMPAVLQILSFLTDYGMSVDEACHQPRIDVSGTPYVIADSRLSEEVIDGLSGQHTVQRAQHGVYPALFACPNLVAHDPTGGRNYGSAFVMSPWSSAAAAR